MAGLALGWRAPRAAGRPPAPRPALPRTVVREGKYGASPRRRRRGAVRTARRAVGEWGLESNVAGAANRASSPSSPIRDYYKQTQDHLAVPLTLGIYLIGIAGLWVHLYVGWGKTVHKLEVSKEMKPYVTDFGNVVATLICLGFASVAVYFHLTAHGGYGMM